MDIGKLECYQHQNNDGYDYEEYYLYPDPVKCLSTSGPVENYV